MTVKRENWSREELIIAFNLYCRTSFGQINKSNLNIIDIAEKLGRTPSAVSMKMCNFARFDPQLQKRNVRGLEHGSKEDKKIWDEFNGDWENLAFESQRILYDFGYTLEKEKDIQSDLLRNFKRTELKRSVKVRLVQSFFRDTVLASYDFSCAICSLSTPAMLNASHIIPWSKSKTRRVDPRNGISLCVLHDRAFDKGLITVDEGYCVQLSKKLKQKRKCPLFEVAFNEVAGKKIKMPVRFFPDQNALDYHRQEIFLH